LLQQNFFYKNKLDIIIIIVKIFVIIFAAYSIFGNFIPFYEGANPYYVGASAVKFAEGEFILSNELLEKYGTDEFVPGNWFITNQNTAVPSHSTGLITLASIFYQIGGYYGLFYLAPIFSIILLVVSERISSKIFGNVAGLITLLILATSNLLYRVSTELMTETVFSVFFILGIFFTIKFVKERKNYQIFLASSLFVYSTWIRMAGLISFPIEIIFVITYFIIIEIKNIKYNQGSINLKILYVIGINKIKTKKVLKTFGFLILPWIILLLGNMMFFSYFFDDPTANYLTIEQTINFDYTADTLIEFESKDFENMKIYSKYLLPYQIPGAYNQLEVKYDNYFGENWPGLIAIIFLIGIAIISIRTKDHRIYILLFTIFIISHVWFYSAITWEERSDGKEIPARYMIPDFILFSMIIGFTVEKSLKLNIKKYHHIKKIIKFLIIMGLTIFFVGAFYFYPSVQNGEIYFKDPNEYAEKYPLDLEEIPMNSIILASNSIRVIEYDGLISYDANPPRTQVYSVELLKKLSDEGHEIYMFKKPFTYNTLEIRNTLVEEYKVILKEHSKTFCKVEFNDLKNTKSDEGCLNNEPIRIPYFMK
jgi:hypothetical protein